MIKPEGEATFEEWFAAKYPETNKAAWSEKHDPKYANASQGNTATKERLREAWNAALAKAPQAAAEECSQEGCTRLAIARYCVEHQWPKAAAPEAKGETLMLIPAIKHVQGLVNDERPQAEVLFALDMLLKSAYVLGSKKEVEG